MREWEKVRRAKTFQIILSEPKRFCNFFAGENTCTVTTHTFRMHTCCLTLNRKKTKPKIIIYEKDVFFKLYEASTCAYNSLN